ncbi:MAG: hypothetical protein LC754_09005 [Acidobacteria bacterium]|nr:hypothetical protein [Acidobacteriota bacterium]
MATEHEQFPHFIPFTRIVTVFVPAMGSTDPVAHSLAESLFWLDQELEHTKFFIMHMPLS